MKKLVLTVLICLLAFSDSFAQNWEKYKSQDLAFTSMFPNTPERTVQKVQTAVGKLDMHMIMYTPESDDDNAVYSVIRSDYPKEQFENADEDYNNTVLDGAVNGAVNNVNGTLVYDNKVTLNGYPGRSFKTQIQGGYIYINAYLVENTMFIIQVITLVDNDGNDSIDKFLNAFDIIKVK